MTLLVTPLYFKLSIYQYIYLSFFQSLYLPINLSIFSSIYLLVRRLCQLHHYRNGSNYQYIYLSFFQSIYLPFYLSISSSIFLQVKRLCQLHHYRNGSNYQYIYLSFFQSLYLPIYLFIYLSIGQKTLLVTPLQKWIFVLVKILSNYCLYRIWTLGVVYPMHRLEPFITLPSKIKVKQMIIIANFYPFPVL